MFLNFSYIFNFPFFYFLLSPPKQMSFFHILLSSLSPDMIFHTDSCCSFVGLSTDSLWCLFSNNDYLKQKSFSEVPLIPFKLPKLFRGGQTVKRGADLQSWGQSSENTRSGCELRNQSAV